MKIPPFWIRLRIVESGKKRISLWLPLFIIGPIVLIVGIILSPLVLIAALILWRSGKGRPLLLGLPMITYLICCMRGLVLDVNSDRNQVFIKVK